MLKKSFFGKLISSPFCDICFCKQNIVLSLIALMLILIASFLEGASFACILFCFMSLSGSGSGFLFSKLSPFLVGFSNIQIFSIFVLVAVVAQIIRSLLLYFGRIMSARLSSNLQVRTQSIITSNIFNLSFSAVNNYKVGDLIYYTTSPASYFAPIVDGISNATVSLFMIMGYFIIMFKISFLLTCSIFLLFGVIFFLQKIVFEKLSKVSNSYWSDIVFFNKEVEQNLSGLRLIHTFYRKGYVLQRIREMLDAIYVNSLRLNKITQIIPPIYEMITVLLVAMTVVLGVLFLHTNNSDVLPVLLTFLTLTYRLGTRLSALIGGFGSIFSQIGNLSKLKEILVDKSCDTEASTCLSTVSFQDNIELKNVYLKYPGKNTYAIKNVSMSLTKGSTVALVGSSGGGKSSLIDLIVRLYEPTSGNIYVDGCKADKFSMQSWRDLFGVVSQDIFLFHDTILENIKFGNFQASYEQVVEAAKFAGAHSFIEHLPDGYNTVVGERGHRLSGGEKQRVSLARAIVKNPQILVLDEATSHLDSESEFIIQEVLSGFRGKITLLIVAHRLSTICRADQIFVINKGEIVESGTHNDLIKKRGSYCNFWNLQSSGKEELVSALSSSTRL